MDSHTEDVGFFEEGCFAGGDGEIPMTQDCIVWNEKRKSGRRSSGGNTPKRLAMMMGATPQSSFGLKRHPLAGMSSEEKRANFEESERELDAIFDSLREQGVTFEEKNGSTPTTIDTTRKDAMAAPAPLGVADRGQAMRKRARYEKKPEERIVEGSGRLFGIGLGSSGGGSPKVAGFADLLKQIQADSKMPPPIPRSVATTNTTNLAQHKKPQALHPKNVYKRQPSRDAKTAKSVPPPSKPSVETQHSKVKHDKDPFDDWDLNDAELAKMDSLIADKTLSHTHLPSENQMARITDKENDPPINIPVEMAPSDLALNRSQTNVQSKILVKDSAQDDDAFVDFPDDLLAKVDLSKAKVPVALDLDVKNQDEDDPFGDFPDLDIDAIDKTVANHLSGTTQDIPNTAPPPVDAVVMNPKNPNDMQGLVFSRYLVLRVDNYATMYTKTVTVSKWKNEMLQENERAKAIHRRETFAQTNLDDIESAWSNDGLLHLRGEWYHADLAPGDVIHVCSLSGQFSTHSLPLLLHTSPPAGSIKDDLILVVHPDLLLTPTYITEAISCPRRAVIKQRLGSTGIASEYPLYGTMRHQLFEETMKNSDFSLKSAGGFIDKIIRQNAEALLACGVSSGDARAEMLKFLPTLQKFASEASSLGSFQGSRQPTRVQSYDGDTFHFLAEAVDSIEEAVMSSELGMKGFIDMVVSAVFHRTNDSARRSNVCIELKTGHSQYTNPAHMAQLVLYTLMIRAKYGSEENDGVPHSSAGLLLYMNAGGYKTLPISPRQNEIKSLIGQRNALAIDSINSLKPRGVKLILGGDTDESSRKKEDLLEEAPATVLPALNDSLRQCEKCFANQECMLYFASSKTKSPMHDDLKKKITGHLTEDDFDYFRSWDRLIDIEADFSSFNISEALLIPSYEREVSTSRTMSALSYVRSSSLLGEDTESQDLVSFRRHQSASQSTPLASLGFEVGCSVVISLDTTPLNRSSLGHSQRQICIGRGFVHKLGDDVVSFRFGGASHKRITKLADKNAVFRIDREESAAGIGTLRQNLISLFAFNSSSKKQTITANLRRMIVKLESPKFQEINHRAIFQSSIDNSIPGCDPNNLVEEYADLNSDQMNAVQKVVSASDYALIQGLPGTGKTSTIAFVARLLAMKGKRVLISSYTHSAVDNVFMKLIKSGVAEKDSYGMRRMVRVGTKSSCHSSVRPYLVTELAKEHDVGNSEEKEASVEALQKVVSHAKIVFVTALTVARSQLLVNESFDVVIVDEAGQISQPAIIGPLMAARTFVLVGDHMQLPPLVNSELAESGGYGVSMLQRLATEHPASVAQLRQQYRMNKHICALSNDVAYKGKLKCANEEVGNRRLKLIRFMTDYKHISKQQEWISRALDPENPVVFLDTDGITDKKLGKENLFLERTSSGRKSGSIVNDTEIEIVRIITGALLRCELPASDVGIICPFRAQLRLMDDCESLHQMKMEGVEMSTIDKYQGRDKEAIVLSFVRSNAGGKVGRILQDFRRLNVAVSRARSKLILIGSMKTLYSGSDVLKSALDRIVTEGVVVKLPSAY